MRRLAYKLTSSKPQSSSSSSKSAREVEDELNLTSFKVRAGGAEVREALLWDKSAVPLLDFPTQLVQHRQAPKSMLSINLATTT